MANQNRFAVTPTVSITRSKFKRFSQRKTSIKIGEITPIFLDEVLPGDTRRIDIGALIRMNTPVVPVMDNIYFDYYAFYCPNRLVWEHWKEFMGENNSSAGIYQGTEYTVPTTDIFYGIQRIQVGSLGDHLGLPITYSLSGSLKVSALPGRIYKLIYNEWFRDQNLISPVNISTGDDGGDVSYNMPLFKAAKFSDYFTRGLPYAQKGNPVSIPLGSTAPVKFDTTKTSFISRAYYAGTTTEVTQGDSLIVGDQAEITAGGDPVYIKQADGQYYADLTTATAATINQLRFAFQYQKFLERDALYGTRYWEILKGHFGISAPDASLQRPELLGHWKQSINIDQVLQTTGQDISTPSQNELGSTGAVSLTGGYSNLVSKSFVEHGYIMILAVARHDQTYGQGVARSWTRSIRTDFYDPLFANLGAQVIKNKEIYVSGSSGTDDAAFAFQEAWAEYRYKPSEVCGILRPNVASSLGMWTLANNFGSLPTLSQSFIEQTNDNIKRAIGTYSQDFICDFAFTDIAVRPMPVYSVPGLIDHH